MGLPKSKYSSPKHTPGGEFLLNKENYIGWYVVTYKNEYLTGKQAKDSSKKLIPVAKEQVIKPLFVEDKVEPNLTVVKNGIWTRYFLKKISNQKIIEVSKKKYLFFDKAPNIESAKLDWIIQGPVENRLINNYLYYGAEHNNRIATLKLNNTLDGISSYITDYTEFVN
jgi:hypothetical protein